MATEGSQSLQHFVFEQGISRPLVFCLSASVKCNFTARDATRKQRYHLAPCMGSIAEQQHLASKQFESDDVVMRVHESVECAPDACVAERARSLGRAVRAGNLIGMQPDHPVQHRLKQIPIIVAGVSSVIPTPETARPSPSPLRRVRRSQRRAATAP